jgi:PRTRC genetic system protein F
VATATAYGVMLPQIAAGIPARLTGGEAIQRNASVTLMLLDACRDLGIAVQGDREDALNAVCAALNGWVAQQLGALKIFTPSFTLRPHLSERDYYRSARERAQVKFDSVDIVWQSKRIVPVSVGERIEYLEHAVPGLGATALRALNKSRETFTILTPDSVLGLASYMYWGCEEDESSYLDQVAENDADRADIMGNMVTRKMVDEAFPAWAVGKKAQVLGDKTLKALAAASDGYICDVVLCVRRLRKLKVPQWTLEMDGEFIDFSAVACWRDDDIVLRVADDLVNMAHQSEYCEISGEEVFALDAPDTLAAWLKSMQSFFAATATVDHLLWLVTKADYRNYRLGGDTP